MGALVTQPRLEVVLPTYNGALYLEAQLASIHAQSLRPERIFLRDDGSTDGTVELIQELQQRYGDWLQVLPSATKLGCTSNVNALLQATTAPYVALADQDDYWLPDKLQTAFRQLQHLEAIHRSETPLLVHSDLELVDADLCSLRLRYWRKQRLHPQRTALRDLALTNVVTGCTVLVNRSLLDQALPIPPEALMHDWWLALVASARGRLEVVSPPGVLYRQHRANVLGSRGTAPLAMMAKLLRPRAHRPPAQLRAVARQASVLSVRFGLEPHPLCRLMLQPRWLRTWRLLWDPSLRSALRKHGPLRTWGLWLVIGLASPLSRSQA